MDEEDIQNNYCADLVSLTRLEPALLHLFGAKRFGEWVKVVELYRIAGQPAEGIKPEVVAAWLPSPTGTSGDAIVLFYDEDSLWSMTAWYDVARLRSHPPAAVAAAVG